MNLRLIPSHARFALPGFLAMCCAAAAASAPFPADDRGVQLGSASAEIGSTVFLSPLLRAAGPEAEVMKGALRLEFLPELVEALPSAGNFSLLQFPLPDGSSHDLVLYEFSALSSDAVFTVTFPAADGQPERHERVTPQVRTFRGKLATDADSLVFLSFARESVAGFIRMQGRTFSISNGPRGELPVMISDLQGLPEGAIDWIPYACGTAPMAGRKPTGSGGDGGIAALETCRVVKMAFETDIEFRQLFGSNQAAIDYLVQIAAGKNTIYYADQNIWPQLVYGRVFNSGPLTGDPWTITTNFSAALDQFQTLYQTQNLPNDPQNTAKNALVRHFISGKQLGGGQAQGIGINCPAVYDPPPGAVSPTPANHCISTSLNGFFPYPLQSNEPQNWDIVVTTHEMGHLLGCWHTHQQGFATPPGANWDECGNGGCSGASSIGTIMSYCHLCAGGLGNIALNFAPPNIGNMDLLFEDLAGCPANPGAMSIPCPIFDPQNFVASDGESEFGCQLTWDLPAAPQNFFEIERRPLTNPPGGVWTDVTTLNGSLDSYLDVAVPVEVRYEYRIRSIPGAPPPAPNPNWITEQGYRGQTGPTGLAATDGDFADRVELDWIAPTGYTPICYHIYRDDGSGVFLKIDQTTQTSYDDNGQYEFPQVNPTPTPPAVGVRYTYRVRAVTQPVSVNAPCGPVEGSTPWLSAASDDDGGFVSRPGPSNVVASGVQGGLLNGVLAPPFTNRIRISWTLPPGPPANRIYVYRKVSESDFVEVASLSGQATSWSDTLNLSDVGYTYKVRSFQNLLGLSVYSNADLGFRLDPPTVSSASDGTANSVLVRWSPPTTWSPISYSLWRKRSGRDPWPADPITSGIPATQTSFVDTTAVAGEVYVYAVTATSAQFQSPSERGRTDIGYPIVLPPTGMTATDGASPGFVYISWTANGATTNVSWQIFRRVAGSNSPFSLIRTVTQPFHYDTTAAPSTIYEYHVRTRASNGVVSAPSAGDNGYR